MGRAVKKLIAIGIFVAILVAAATLFLFDHWDSCLAIDRKGFRARVVHPMAVSVCQLPSVFEQLKANHKDASWAAFVFCPPDGPANDEAAVNLQCSVEKGVVGFDWVLLVPPTKLTKTRLLPLLLNDITRC